MFFFQMIVAHLKVKQLERRIEMEEDYDDGGMYEARYKRQKVCEYTCTTVHSVV